MPFRSPARGRSGRRPSSLLRRARGLLLAPLAGALALALPDPRGDAALRAQAPAAPPTAATPAAATPATPAAASARPDSALSPVARARQAQAQYETTHRKLLRMWTGSPGPCEVKIGTLCYWNNNLDEAAPAERPAVAAERTKLLATLATTQAAAPTDDWVVGQRVRYLVEAGHADSALTVARECRGTAWWCSALRGYALHVGGRYTPALAAFDSATSRLSAEERCRWDDLGAWLGQRTRELWQRAGCGTPARTALAGRLWTFARPLWTLGADDLRSEWNARQLSARLHADAANAYGLPWAGPTAEVELRFGWATAWSLADVPADTARGPWNVVGHEPVPSFAFFPSDDRLAPALTGSVSSLAPSAWALYAPGVRMRYAPQWARGGLLELDHVRAVQVARFRRGDTSVVTASWALGRDTTGFEGAARWQGKPLQGALLLLDDSLATVARAERAGAPARGALLVREARALGGRARLYGLELRADEARRAARSRGAVATLAADAPLSDILLVASGVAPDARLEGVLASAHGSTAIRGGSSIGLYWEQYRRTTPDRPDSIAVSATRLTQSASEKFKSKLGIDVIQRPVRVRLVDRGRPDGHPGRALTVAWPEVPPGDYRLDLVVTPVGGEAATTSLVVRLEGAP